MQRMQRAPGSTKSNAGIGSEKTYGCLKLETGVMLKVSFWKESYEEFMLERDNLSLWKSPLNHGTGDQTIEAEPDTTDAWEALEGLGRILQNHQKRVNRTNTDTRTDRVQKSRKYLAKGTDVAKITRKRSKPNKHGHENGKSAKEPEVSGKRFECYMPSQQRKHHLKGSHWSIRDKNDTIEAKKHTLKWDFALKPLVKKHKPLTHGLPRWQSVCSHFDPTDTRWELMIGSKQGPRLI
ncbi:hypothetical protein Tco_0268920 [Tanacetum coccineum]